MKEKAYFHLPGLFEFYELYRMFLPLFREHREYFYDWCEIGSIYGAPADCIWGGGRAGFGENDPEEVLELITPKFETSFDFFAVWEEGEVKRKGNFEDVMFDMSQLSEKDYYALSAYSAYIGYDYAYNTIVNNDAPNDIKILLLRDSYSCAMLPFLSINAKEITAVDLRHYDGNVSELVENGDFDVVLIAYNPYVIMKTMFDFGD